MTRIASLILAWLAGVVAASAMPPNRAGAPPYTTDGTYTYFTAPDTPSNNLKLKIARSKPVILYRLIRRTGIMRVAGAEIFLPGLPRTVKREVSAQLDHLDVIDMAADGTQSFSSWDISALTNPYLPPTPKPGDDTSWRASQNDHSELEDVRWRHDTTLTIHLNEAGEAVYGPDLSQTRLGSVFVDDENRLFFTPPKGATLFYPKPKDVYEIESVTHLARKGIIVFEWIRENDQRYHVEALNVKTRQPMYSFPLGDDLTVHEMLTWVDDHRLLGRFVARMFSACGVVNLRRHTVTEQSTDQGYDPIIIRKGSVNRYHLPDPDDQPERFPPTD